MKRKKFATISMNVQVGSYFQGHSDVGEKVMMVTFLRVLGQVTVNSNNIPYISKRKIINSTQYP